MPIHDWTRVTAGTFHAFHHSWISELQLALNSGVLPEDYYAQAEQVASEFVPDVLTLQESAGAAATEDDPAGAWAGDEATGGVAVAVAPPRVSLSDLAIEAEVLAERRKAIVLRHTTGDRVVALLEIVSPGSKQSRASVSAFVEKAAAVVRSGHHLTVLDLFPPGLLDPDGMHARVWHRLGGRGYEAPPAKPLTLAAYAARQPEPGGVRCYVEPTATGASLIDMPLFLNPTHYVNVPLERTYMAAYEGVPRRWKRVLEG